MVGLKYAATAPDCHIHTTLALARPSFKKLDTDKHLSSQTRELYTRLRQGEAYMEEKGIARLSLA